MTEADRRQIIALWETQVPIKQIYRMLPYRRCEVVNMVAELRANGTLKPRKKTEKTAKAIAEAWHAQTKNIYELSEMFGLGVRTIYKYLAATDCTDGVRTAHNHKKRELNKKAQEIISAIDEGKSTAEICKTFGVSRQYVHQLKQTIL